VIGPYDSTPRYWEYHLWILISDIYPVHLPKKKKKLSFVFSEDVATAITAVLNAKDKAYNKAYNIACIETPTLEEYLNLIGEQLKVKINFTADISDEDREEFYPSVDFGTLDITRALTELNWKPKTLTEALTKTSNFYVTAWHKYPGNKPKLHFPKSVLKVLNERLSITS